MQHIADVAMFGEEVIGNTGLKALCGATGSKVLPAGAEKTDLCPRCAELAGVSK